MYRLEKKFDSERQTVCQTDNWEVSLTPVKGLGLRTGQQVTAPIPRDRIIESTGVNSAKKAYYFSHVLPQESHILN